MEKTQRVGVVDALFPLAIATTILVLYIVYIEVGAVVATKGVYALIGLLVAAAVYYQYPVEDAVCQSTIRWSRNNVFHILLILASFSIMVTVMTESKLLGFLIFLPVGYGLLALEILDDAPTDQLLAQTLVLFSVPLLLEYLTAGFYFGNGDLFKHVLSIDRLLTEGSITAIFSMYEYFPGFHLLIGVVSLFTGLQPYDALLLVGMVVYAEAILIVYLLARILLNGRVLPLLIAITATTLTPISFFATYFFPQSLAVVLLLHILLVCLYADIFQRRTLSVIALVLGSALVFTHHLTIVLFTPILGLLAIGGKFASWIYLFNRDNASFSDVIEPRYIPIGVVWLASIAYWIILRVFVAGLVLQALLISNQYGTLKNSRSFYRFGIAANSETVWTALSSLASPLGVYSITLFAMFSLGMASYVTLNRNYTRTIGVILVGIAGAIFLLPSPLGGKGFERLSHPISFFFAFVVGYGLYYLIVASRLRRVPGVLFVIVMVVLGSLGPMLAGGDIYYLDQERESQKALSEEELEQIQAISTFNNRYGSDVTTDWITGEAMKRYRQYDVRQVAISDNGLRQGNGILIYRKRWADHVVVLSNSTQQSRFIMSEKWLDRAERHNSKVYDNSRVSAMWNSEPTIGVKGT